MSRGVWAFASGARNVTQSPKRSKLPSQARETAMKRFSTNFGITTLLVIMGLTMSVGAQAHTHLKQSTPAEGSVVTVSPSNIVLKFSEAARVTALTLQKNGETATQKLAPLPIEAATEVTVPAPKLVAGKYAVTWRVVSDDNHIMSGTLHFTVAPAAVGSGTPPAS